MKTRGDDWGKVFIGVRYQPQNPAWFTESYAGLCQFGLRDGDKRDFVYSKTMHKAANMLVRRFLETDCDTLCFIDSDAVFGTNALEELRRDPEGFQYDVLQAFTVKRGFPPEPMYLTEMPDQPESDDKYRGRHMMSNLPLDADRIYPVDAVSLHFTLIRRELLEKMISPKGVNLTYWFEYREDNGEDITFSWNARQVGAKLGMTTRLKVGHVGEGIYGWDSMVEYYYYKFLHDSGKLPSPSLEFFASYFNAQKALAELVAEYTHEDPELVYARSLSGAAAVADRWKLANPQTPEQVRSFYGSTPQYLYDLVRWNASPVYQNLMFVLRELRGQRVLEIGGGLGTITEFLATHGNQVDYYDVPGVLRDFATWRFARLNGYRENIQIIERWEMEVFDLVIAIDVIEHIHPDEVETMLTGLVAALKPGGVLMAHNNFARGGNYPQHYDHSEIWDAFVAKHQLKQVSHVEWQKP